MRRTFYRFLAALILFLSMAQVSQAITVTTTQNPAAPLSVNVAVVYTKTSILVASMDVDFGDGLHTVSPTCAGLGPCSLTVSHTYASAGTYTILATASFGVSAPNPGVTTVTVPLVVLPAITITSPSPLPAGTLSGAYNFQLQTSGGQTPLAYSLLSGTLPPGLSLSSSGQISGSPTSLGTFFFSVQVKDFNNQTASKAFSLTVNPPAVSGPSSLTTSAPRGVVSTRTIPYQLTASTPVNLPLISNAGVFSVRGAVVGTNNQTVAVPLQNGRGQASETITINPSLIERALNLGSNTVLYQRSFGFSTGGSAVSTTLTINITTESGAAFDIKKIQLYFDDRRVDVSVDRNFPKLKAYADILTLGSGLLQGYWTVDGRIVSYVTQPVTSGELLRLQTPDIPPLPTFDLGTHLVKFIITNPVTPVPMPAIIYYVNPTESQAALTKIFLVSPEPSSIHSFSPLTFQWEGLNIFSLYLIEFFDEGKGITPVFSAFTKRPLYSLPNEGFSKFFNKETMYFWKVTGLNEAKNQIGESERWGFSFK